MTRTAHYRPYTEAEQAEIRRRFALGHTDACIGAALGTSAGSIAQARKGLGLYRASHRKVWTDEMREVVRREYPTCKDKDALATRLGCSRSHLRTVASEMQVRDELHHQREQARQKAVRSLTRRTTISEAEERRLSRARQLLADLPDGPVSLRHLWRVSGWVPDAVRAIAAESPDLIGLLDGMIWRIER